MAKRWRKQKAEAQQKKKRKQPGAGGGGDSSSSSSGAIGGLRRMTQGFFGRSTGPKKPRSAAAKVFDVLLWVAVAVMAYVVISRRCTQ